MNKIFVNLQLHKLTYQKTTYVGSYKSEAGP